ncbi:MAG: phospholipase A [Thiotrichales bacterium]
MFRASLVTALLLCLFSGLSVAAAPRDVLQQCYIDQVKTSGPGVSVRDIRAVCEFLAEKSASKENAVTALDRRILGEQRTQNSENVITPHKRNYILPVSYAFSPDHDPFANSPNTDQLENVEAKFQISFKAPILEGIFQKNQDALYFGFTLQSYWQMYNFTLSSPFRETNYQPEIFYARLNNWSIGGWKNKILLLGFEHQSNGQTGLLSRSWNRLYLQAFWERKNTVLSLRPWYRIPEKEKRFPQDALGDDNPDIHHYLGHFEFSAITKTRRHTWSILLRNNLRSDNKGAIEIGWTYPLAGRFKGYAQLFSGYGESLIDYNNSVTRLGFGILLTDFF